MKTMATSPNIRFKFLENALSRIRSR